VWSGDDGSIGLVTGAVGIVILLLTVALAGIGGVHSSRLRATTAADAAALAAAPVTFMPFGADGTPTEEAERFARLNGAQLVSCDCAVDRSFEPRSATVRVRVIVHIPVIGSFAAEATGRAEFVPAALLGAD
jgi:hypothetical protein